MPGFELYGAEERQAILEWFDASNGVMFAHGFDGRRNGIYKVREFEKAIAAHVKAKYCQVTSSCTAALLVALRSMGVKAGDEVITQSFTFVATVEAIIETGATPVIAEVDKSLNMDPADLEKKITKKTKAVIPVHMAGAAADMDSILEIAKRHDLIVFEDTAQSFGGTYKGKSLGTLGIAGAYSYDFGKNITTGEGGAIVTNDRGLFDRMRACHDHGHEYNPEKSRVDDTRHAPGFNYRMTEIQAVLGLTQLKKIDYIIETQRKNKAAIKSAIADCGFEFRHLHDEEGDIGDSLIFFMETKEKATAFAKKFFERGYGTKNLPDALRWHFSGDWEHMFGAYPSLAHPETLWPRSDDLLRRAIALPIMVKMTGEDIAKTIDTVKAIAKEVA